MAYIEKPNKELSVGETIIFALQIYRKRFKQIILPSIIAPLINWGIMLLILNNVFNAVISYGPRELTGRQVPAIFQSDIFVARA